MTSSTSTRLLRLALRASAWTLAVAWTAKAISVARGIRCVPRLTDLAWDRPPAGQPSVTVVVPARNEVADLAGCLHSLLAQDYPKLHIIAVDDRSTDGTGDLIDRIAHAHPDRLAALHIIHLPPGWLGKTHAMHGAAQLALAARPTSFLLFTDGDVSFSPQVIRRALTLAQAQAVDHLVVLPSPLALSAGEAVVLGFLQIMGFWSLRPWKVPDPGARDAIGIGAFNLLRASAYARLGGYQSVRYQIVEDLALGRRVKQLGLRQQVAFAPNLLRLHWASGVQGLVRTMTKNLFAIFAYRPSLVLLAAAGTSVLCFGPVAGLLARRTRLPSLIAAGAIASLYILARDLSGLSPLTALGFPLSASVVLYAILRSTVVTLWHGGVTWRDTFYPLADLRRSTLPAFLFRPTFPPAPPHPSHTASPRSDPESPGTPRRSDPPSAS